MFTTAEQWIARKFFECGVVMVKGGDHPNGFRLKLHEKQPDAPLSPVFLNLRTAENPKPGPLTRKIVGVIGAELNRHAALLELDFTVVAGIPNAGDPFAEVFVKTVHPNMRVPLLVFGKQVEEGGKRHITGLIKEKGTGKACPGDVLLFVDDVVTKAETKIEAIKAAESAGLLVHDILVVVDREQGGAQELKAAGYQLHALFKISALLDFYVDLQFITAEMRQEILDYLAAN